MNNKLKKIIIGSTIGLGTVAVTGTIVYEMYDFSSSQGEKRFVTPEHTTIEQFFGKQTPNAKSEPLIREKYIAGEKGYIVNNGPVRITTAYKSLFTKDSLISLSNWIHDDVTWGANAVSLKNVTFTTGVDKTEQGTTKGFHTAGRTGSAIFISPDAFEDLGQIGDDVFKKISGTLVSGYRTKLQSQVAASNTKGELDPKIDPGLGSFLQKQFNGVSSGVSNTGTYKSLDNKAVEGKYKEMVDDAWSDDYISKIKGSQLSTAATSTLLGNLNFTNPERIAYMITHNKLDEGLDKYKTKLAFNAAYKLLLASTGGDNGLGNTYLSLALKNILFEEGEAKDDAGNTVMYKLRDRADWDSFSGVSANSPSFKSDTDSVLVPDLKDGYFKKLNSELGIPAKTVNLRAGIYQLFLKYFDNAMSYLNKENSPYKVISDMWHDSKVVATNTWINEARTFGPSDRVRWILSGKFPQEVKLNVLYGDEWMLTKADKTYIDTVNPDDILDRTVPVDVESVYSDAIEKKYDVLGKLSIADYYRKLMMSSVKYTISHEYGHHETMWSTYGVYGQDDPKQTGNFEDTINLYSDTTAAKGEDFIWRSAFDDLRKIATDGATSTNGIAEQGIRNALDIMMKSGDKYSSTWTPSYFVHQYSGYTPQSGWSHSSETLTQPKLEFKTDENGNPQITLGDTETIGKTPIEFDTNGVDSNGQQNQSNYLFSIDKNKLSDDNPAKSDSTRIGDFLRLMVTPAQLLYGYQTSQWLLDGHKNGDQWSTDNGIALPDIDTSGLKEPTTQFSALLAQDPSDKTSKMMSLIGILRLQYGLQDQYALEIIKQLDAQIKVLYNKLVKATSNLFEPDKAGNPRMNGYDRSKTIFNQIMSDTVKLLKGNSGDEYDPLKSNYGIYYDPKTVSYIALQTPDNFDSSGDWISMSSEKINKLFDQNKDSSLVKAGTVVLGSPQTAFSDYTGNFAEFMTRIVQQLTYRPAYDEFKGIDGKIDKAQLVKANEGWFDDTNRFNAQGMNMYNMKGMNSSLTATGAKLMNWYRSILGLHVSEPNQIKMNGKLVDYDALDNSVSYADPISRIYRNSKTNLTTMWGWIPNKMKDTYKFVVLKDKNTNKEFKIPMNLKNISNYFYRTDMNHDANKHSMNNGYTEWVADWSIMGNYVNADIKNGNYTMLFADASGKTYNPYTDNVNPTTDKKSESRTNNDYNGTLAEMRYTIDPKSQKIEIEIN